MMTEENTNGDETPEIRQKRLKVTVVGDSGVGKTCMLMTFVKKKYPTGNDVPSLYENSTIKAGREGSFEVPVTLETGGREVELGLTDTIGLDEYRRLRELFGANTDIFLVCFSVTDPTTLQNVKDKWLTEIRILTPKAPFILVGTKTDLREDESVLEALKQKDMEAISIQQAIKMGKTFGAKAYVECSAINNIGVKHVFETVDLILNERKEDSKNKKMSKHNEFCTVS